MHPDIMKTLRRTIHPEIRVIDSKAGLVEYIASDETLDSYREVIKADGWRFDNFKKNAPFVDSHDYGSIEKLLGKVVDFKVSGKRLIETVQWAKDVESNVLAQRGWAMTEAGFLKAVSVGFWPVRQVSRWDTDPYGYNQAVADLGLKDSADEAKPRTIFLEQQQIELSAVIIGANPNAIARSYKAGILNDDDLIYFDEEQKRLESSSLTDEDALVREQRARRRSLFLAVLQLTRKI